MKQSYFFVALLLSFSMAANARVEPSRTRHSLSFIENNGQIKDQDGRLRNDIQFVLPANNINIFVGNGQLHYQFMRTEMLNANQPGTYIKPELRKDADVDRYEEPFKANIHTYRLDVELIGARISGAPVTGKKQAYYENYYTPGCPQQGIRAYSYDKVTYRDVYPGIDWVLYVNGNKLEHEFVVSKHADASLIKLRYKGHTGLRINSDGSLLAATPMGTITEKAPVCYTADGNLIKSSYKLDGNVLSYDLHGFNDAVLIDPELMWGTYYGPDSSTSPFYDVYAYDSASLYACGLTWSGYTGSIATTGAYQYSNAGSTDAYLVKFDTGGIRQWATYFGGTDGDYGTSVTCDASGQIYMCGLTPSTSGISTPGCQQPVYGGGSSDGFLAKFAPDGSRTWATYIGGNGSNFSWGVSTDIAGWIYVSGDTNEPTNISTPGSHQENKSGGFDWYLIQYDAAGMRSWGTYIGGPANEWNGTSCTDGYSAYVTGWTNSLTGIASAFGHQTTLGGASDAAVIKIVSSGVFSWGTYYGGTGSETVGGIACDIFKNIYLFGHTDSDNNISTPGSFHPARAGLTDGFLVKFHPEVGFRMWGTYFGGALQERADKSRIDTDDSANIYILGATSSASGVATDSVWQTVYGGGDDDGFLAKFNHIGEQKWCTYIGGSRNDEPRSVSCFANGVFICGSTTSADSIATPDGFMPTGGSLGAAFNFQGFMEKFAEIDTSSIPEDTTTVPVSIVTKSTGGHVSLFPNPNNGTFSMQGAIGNRTGIAEYTITDATGRIVLRQRTAVHNGSVSEHVSLGTAGAGIYFLRFRSPEGIEQVIPFRKE